MASGAENIYPLPPRAGLPMGAEAPRTPGAGREGRKEGARRRGGSAVPKIWGGGTRRRWKGIGGRLTSGYQGGLRRCHPPIPLYGPGEGEEGAPRPHPKGWEKGGGKMGGGQGKGKERHHHPPLKSGGVSLTEHSIIQAFVQNILIKILSDIDTHTNDRTLLS